MRALVLPILMPLRRRRSCCSRRSGRCCSDGLRSPGRCCCLPARVVLFGRVEERRHPSVASRRMAGAIRHYPGRGSAGGACWWLRSASSRVAVTTAAFAGVDPRREAFGYHPLVQILLMGVSGAFLTGDFFNLYVWFEVMLVASFVLMALHRNQRASRGGVQVRHDQPDRVVDLSDRARAAVRDGRHAQHGRPRAGLADDSNAPAWTWCWPRCS